MAAGIAGSEFDAGVHTAVASGQRDRDTAHWIGQRLQPAEGGAVCAVGQGRSGRGQVIMGFETAVVAAIGAGGDKEFVVRRGADGCDTRGSDARQLRHHAWKWRGAEGIHKDHTVGRNRTEREDLPAGPGQAGAGIAHIGETGGDRSAPGHAAIGIQGGESQGAGGGIGERELFRRIAQRDVPFRRQA